MTLEEVMVEVAERGLSLAEKDGQVVLRGDRARVTPTLLAVLRWHKDGLAQMAQVREREWELEDGTRCRARRPADGWAPPTAWCWRYIDEDVWHLVKQGVSAAEGGVPT